MVIATKLYLEHPDLPFMPTVRSETDVELGVFSGAGTDPEHDVYLFWIEASDFDAVRRAIEEDHTIESFSVVVESDDQWTVLVEYTDDSMLITPMITEVGGLTVEAWSYSNGWMIHAQLPNQQALYELNEYATDNEVHLDILELYQGGETDDGSEYGLTEPQREALVSAYFQGYYDVPRRASLEELAETLDISRTAVSGRLKRGSAQLIEEILAENPD